MPRGLLPTYLLIVALVFTTGQVSAQDLKQRQQKLTHNQQLLFHLRQEKKAVQEQRAKSMREMDDSNSPELIAAIAELEKRIEVSEAIISKLSNDIARQRIYLSEQKKGKPPSALDTALQKALGGNLQDLTQDVVNDPAAQREIARLRALLREEARIGHQTASHDNLVLATDMQTAEMEFLHLLSLFSMAAKESEPDIQEKIATIRGQRNGVPYQERPVLKYLGKKQYHLELTVSSGEMQVAIDQGQPWRFYIPETDNNHRYMMIYDQANAERPRLIMLNKSLISNVDTPFSP